LKQQAKEVSATTTPNVTVTTPAKNNGKKKGHKPKEVAQRKKRRPGSI